MACHLYCWNRTHHNVSLDSTARVIANSSSPSTVSLACLIYVSDMSWLIFVTNGRPVSSPFRPHLCRACSTSSSRNVSCPVGLREDLAEIRITSTVYTNSFLIQLNSRTRIRSRLLNPPSSGALVNDINLSRLQFARSGSTAVASHAGDPANEPAFKVRYPPTSIERLIIHISGPTGTCQCRDLSS